MSTPYSPVGNELGPQILPPEAASLSWMSRTREWAGNHKVSLALGATAASLGITVALNPIKPIMHKVEKAAPWVVPTEVGLDIALGAGAAMMVTSTTGTIVKNPLKAKTYLKDLPQKANESLLFKSGFAVATGSAVSFGGVAIGSILAYLPPEAWGSLSFPVVDLAATVVTQKAIWDGIQRNAQQPNAVDPEANETLAS